MERLVRLILAAAALAVAAPAHAKEWPARPIHIVVGAEVGANPATSTPEELRAHVVSEIAKWSAVRDKAGIPQRQ